MVLGVPFTELLWLATAVIVAGVITGLLAGLFGVGGGAVIVPVLYEVFRLLGVPDEVRMQLCIGTSIAIIVPTTLRSYLAHREKGLVIPGIIRIWAAPAVLGVVCGAVIAAFAPSEVFKIAFIILATFIASKFLLGGDRIGADSAAIEPDCPLRRAARAPAVAPDARNRLCDFPLARVATLCVQLVLVAITDSL